ncbi:MAG: dihydropteroate synthase [Rubripirellula sp.]
MSRDGVSYPLVWNLGRRKLTISHRPLVMGILNVTPDSFSDGGKHHDAEVAVATAIAMQNDGADIIDIGGESTRPYSDPVGVEEELDRVLPVIESLAGKISIPISIDTSKSAVAAAAVQAGAEIINDVTGFDGDPAMVDVAVQTGVGVCVMHMQGNPQTMQDSPSYENVVAEIHAYLMARRDLCLAAGISIDRICLDPGIGFGKTHDHNLTLLKATRTFTDLGCPILIGHSRKGFIRKLLGGGATDLTAGTLGVTLAVAAAGANVVRVHDVRETVQALTLFEASGGLAAAKRQR